MYINTHVYALGGQHGGVVVNTAISLQEGSVFECASWLGYLCVTFLVPLSKDIEIKLPC